MDMAFNWYETHVTTVPLLAWVHCAAAEGTVTAPVTDRRLKVVEAPPRRDERTLTWSEPTVGTVWEWVVERRYRGNRTGVLVKVGVTVGVLVGVKVLVGVLVGVLVLV